MSRSSVPLKNAQLSHVPATLNVGVRQPPIFTGDITRRPTEPSRPLCSSPGKGRQAERTGSLSYGIGETFHSQGWGESSLSAPASTAVLSEAPCLLGDLWGEDNTPGARIAMRFAASKTAAAPWGQGGVYQWDPAWDFNPGHAGGIDVAYADGHAKWMKAGDMRENLTRPTVRNPR